jgi:hypothetical protein
MFIKIMNYPTIAQKPTIDPTNFASLEKVVNQCGAEKWRPGRDSDPGPAGDSRIY